MMGALTALSELTTLRLGGTPGRLVEARSEEELASLPTDAFLLAGGSNVVVADSGFPGTVVRVLTLGAEQSGDRFQVAAGEPWDAFVERCVSEGFAGIECLSGIPGSVGATPIQNVGAYGQEVSETIASVRVLDRRSGKISDLTLEECDFSYRSSAFKREPGRWVVLAVTFELDSQGQSKPIRYPELARKLGVEPGDTAPLPDVREAVLALRRGKGMVIDPSDPDSVSAGSFFTNPVLDADEWERLEARADGEPPRFPEPDGRIKTSAAWLVQHAGFERGYGRPDGIAISSKHTLALTNRGNGTTAELVELALEIATGVENTFGVPLTPEPVFVGHEWPGARHAGEADSEGLDREPGEE